MVSEVMQPAGEADHLIGITLLSVAEHVFDNAASLDPRDDMFEPDAHLRDEPIVGLVLSRYRPLSSGGVLIPSSLQIFLSCFLPSWVSLKYLICLSSKPTNRLFLHRVGFTAVVLALAFVFLRAADRS